MIEDLVKRTRSCRRFNQDRPVSMEMLEYLVNLGRLSGSAANRQPLRYVISCDRKVNAEIFACLAWAAYLKDWKGPSEGQRPAAYIVMLGDTGITSQFWCDDGIAGQSILLGAREKGIAGCMIGAIQHDRLKKVLSIEDRYKIMLVIALGEPAEEVVIETVAEGGDIRYWRDEQGVHHVPKRPMSEVIIGRYTG